MTALFKYLKAAGMNTISNSVNMMMNTSVRLDLYRHSVCVCHKCQTRPLQAQCLCVPQVSG